MNQDTTNSTVTALPSEPQVRSSAGLDALFKQYVTADTEVREITENLLAGNGALRNAKLRAAEAWQKYSNARSESASNNH